MLALIVLGNRLNDDGSISAVMKKRLDMALRLDELFKPDIIIVSGGIANEKAQESEASKMREYLLNNGISFNKIIMEDKSLSTKQNAEYSVPIAAKLGATEILLCTSIEHMSRAYLNPLKLFQKELTKYPHIMMSAFCE